MGFVREKVRHFRKRHLVGFVVHVPSLVVVEADPSHVSENDDGVSFSGASNHFVRSLVKNVFDGSGFFVSETFDDLSALPNFRLSDRLPKLLVVFSNVSNTLTVELRVSVG
jgi:hypothetical protein